MNLAITLLVAIAIASIIGTVLQQNEPYNNYVIKFGPFWFEVFKALGLYDIYGAVWFLFLLGFLLVTTSVCVYRYTPSLLRDMNHFRTDAQEKSLRAFKHHSRWEPEGDVGRMPELAQRFLTGRGYRVRVKTTDDHTMVAAMKGSSSRLGYLFAHVGIVVICLGGLIDGNVPLKWADYTGRIVPETRDIPVSQIPEHSILSEDNAAFRGSVQIPEGGRAGVVFLGMRDGYLVQPLPFRIELEDFRIEHYESGMPKSFESDLVIHDEELDQPLRQTIAVNHPLIYKGYAIYQSSFADGGSLMKMRAWSLDEPGREPLQIEGRVNQSVRINTPRGGYRLELDDFKLFNIFPNEEEGATKKFRNFGPSVVFRLRDSSGQAIEFMNYMSPVQIEGRYFFMSGMRSAVSEPYRYIHIPVGSDGTVKRFMRLRELAMDPERMQGAVEQQMGLLERTDFDPALARQVSDNIVAVVSLFVRQGLDAVFEQVQANFKEEAQQQGAMESYINVIRGVLGGIYIDVLAEEGIKIDQDVTEQDAQFFEDAMTALSLTGPYGSPVLLQLDSFEHVQASGLQITRSPGKDIVYLGCVMLMVGVFFMLYLHHRRVWLRISADGKLLFAGSGHRNRADFSGEFEELERGLRALSAAPGPDDDRAA